MSDPENTPRDEEKSLVTGILKRFAFIMIFLALQGVILFTAAGRMDWVWPWVYLGVSLLIISVNGVIMLRTNPETVAERGQPGETRDWDKLVGGLWGLTLYIVLPAVAGFDQRFLWTQNFGYGWQVAGAALLAASGALSGWAMISNAYFSTAVRIQMDRDHAVCSTGPYAFVRHPGYTGFILQSIGVAMLLGSLWALIPGIAAALLMIVRTILEDRVLQAELPGYTDYAAKVHCRLVPGIW